MIKNIDEIIPIVNFSKDLNLIFGHWFNLSYPLMHLSNNTIYTKLSCNNISNILNFTNNHYNCSNIKQLILNIPYSSLQMNKIIN